MKKLKLPENKLIITKDRYEECMKAKWPFSNNKINQVVLYKIGIARIIRIGRKDYAMNGVAQEMFKLKTPHEAKLIEVGISSYDLVQFYNRFNEL